MYINLTSPLFSSVSALNDETGHQAALIENTGKASTLPAQKIIISGELVPRDSA